MKILFYGNYQLFAILKTLNLNNDIITNYVECFSNDLSESEFTLLINDADIIITLPILDNYRNKPYLSTLSILKNKKEHCKVIIFDSCYFNFYYFDLTYQLFNNVLLKTPNDYHYIQMINCYKNNKDIDYYIDKIVNNIDLKSSIELDKNAINSLTELQNRYNYNKLHYANKNVYIISTYEYIKENYKNKLLFYSMNHPTKYIIQYICEEIIKILEFNNTINYDIDIFYNNNCILYKCISKVVNFDINTCIPVTCNTNVEKITQNYYNVYKEIGLT
jgi:hypothetical protein